MIGAGGSSALHPFFQRALLKSLSFSRKLHQLLPKTKVTCGNWANVFVLLPASDFLLSRAFCLDKRFPVWFISRLINFNRGLDYEKDIDSV
jgi:hypothetical protein